MGPTGKFGAAYDPYVVGPQYVQCCKAWWTELVFFGAASRSNEPDVKRLCEHVFR